MAYCLLSIKFVKFVQLEQNAQQLSSTTLRFTYLCWCYPTNDRPSLRLTQCFGHPHWSRCTPLSSSQSESGPDPGKPLPPLTFCVSAGAICTHQNTTKLCFSVYSFQELTLQSIPIFNHQNKLSSRIQWIICCCYC